MVTAKEKVENPIYQELSGLVLTTKELRDKWFKNEQDRVLHSFQGSVKRVSLERYEHELKALLSKVNACREEYNRTVSHWDKTPTWTNFPHMYKEYRDMITDLSKQKAKVDHEVNLMVEEKRLAKKVEMDMARARERAARTAPPPPKKKGMGFWKGAALAAGIVGGAWLFSNKTSSNSSESSETDTVRRSRVVHVVKKTTTQPATAYTISSTPATVTVVSSGTGRSDSLLPRLREAVDTSMSQNTVPAPSSSFARAVTAKQQRNTLSGLDVVGSANAAQISRNLADVSYSKRRINYNEQYMKVDTVRSWRDVADAANDTTREVKEMTHEVRGTINGFRDMFKKRR